MKHTVGRIKLFAQLTGVFLGGLVIFMPSATGAATCSTSSNYGAVSIQLPQLDKPGDYAIWVRMQASDSKHDKVLVEINQTDCLTFGDSTVTTYKQWQWVPYSNDGSSAATYSFGTTSNNYAKIIGIESDVKVDKIMVAPLGCVPTGSGDGCVAAKPSTEPTANNTVQTVQPLSNVPVSGMVYPTATVQSERASVKAVSYSSDGTFIQRVEGPGMFDTTLVSNGKHSIAIAIAKKDGSVQNEVTVIEVNNPESVLSPVMRWFRLNQRTFYLGAAVVGALLLIRIFWGAIKGSYAKHRYRKFHGF